MVIYMLKNKQINIFNESYKERLQNYFNPYLFSLEGLKEDKDILNMKTKSHNERKKRDK